MKNILFVFLTFIIFASCSGNKEIQVTVENPTDFDRIDELIEIPLDKVEAKIKLGENQAYQVKNNKNEVIPSQVTASNTLIFQSGLKARQSATFIITSGESQKFETKTYGRFITERKDDFAWENDRVAFRIYGPALIATDGPSNGIDIWYKRTPAMIIDKWYKDDLSGKASYHDDHGEGLDDYKVGRTLGAGAMAPFVNDTLWLNENFVSQEILENGPLRTTVKLTYKNIPVDGNSYRETRTISIDAGSQLAKITQEYGVDKPMPVAAGFVKRETNDSIIASVEKGYIIYAEPPSPKADGIYLAMILPTGMERSVVNTYQIAGTTAKQPLPVFSHVLGVTTYQPNTPLTYYTGYGWSKFGFPTVTDFQKYVENYAQGLKQPLIIKY